MTNIFSPKLDALPEWDLTDLYSGSDDPRIEAALIKAKSDADAFAERYRGRIATLTPQDLGDALLAGEEIAREGGKPSNYAGLRFAADASPAVGAFLQRVTERTTAAQLPLLFFDLELTDLGVDRLTELMDDPVLVRWHHYLGEARARAAHQLTEPEERIMAEKANTGSRAFSRLFDELTSNARFTMPGYDRPLTQSEVIDLQYSPDRAVRKASSDALTAGLEAQSRTIAYIFNTLIQDKAVNDRLRRYAYPEESRHISNELTPEIVDTVVQTAEAGYGLVARYYAIKKLLLGLPELTHYDRYAPITATESGDIAWEAARDVVLKAFGEFHPEYRAAAAAFFENGWIDAGPRPGKRGGAFCAYVTPDLHPYILMNYLGKSGDVRTLAHELGHGIHNYLARVQGFFDYHGTIPMAEVASTFAEQLVFEETVVNADPESRLSEYARQIEQAIATIFRQTALYRFEQAIHRERRESGELSVEKFGEIWQKSIGAMFGDSVTLEPGHSYWWSYIGHFVGSSFYVYAYTFGEMLALALYSRYRAEGESFPPRFLDMLRAGGSKTPQELVAPLGVDLADPSFWRGAIDVLEKQVSVFEELVRDIP